MRRASTGQRSMMLYAFTAEVLWSRALFGYFELKSPDVQEEESSS
jgi:hypothetical protein